MTPEELWDRYESFVREDPESSVLIDFGAKPLPGCGKALARLADQIRHDTLEAVLEMCRKIESIQDHGSGESAGAQECVDIIRSLLVRDVPKP